MAVVSTTATWYRSGGASALTGGVGYESGASRSSCARFQFTAPPTGGTTINFETLDCYVGQWHWDGYVYSDYEYMSGCFNWIITQDADAYKYYIGNDGFDCQSTYGDKMYCSNVNVNLMPNQTYYLFIFPDSKMRGQYCIFYISGIRLDITGNYGISSIVATNANIGSTSTISINRYSDAFTHTIQYKITGQSDFTNMVVKTADVSYSWTVPISTYTYLPSTDRNIVITLKCFTYLGNELIGESQTTFTAYAVEDDCKPTLSAAYTLLNDGSALTGNNTTAILNWSNVRITLTASGRNGATIATYTIINAGNTFNVAQQDFTPLTTPTFIYRAVDTRGFITEGNLTITSINYFIPTITLNVVPPNTQTGNTKIKGSGKLFWGSFGVQNNEGTIQYRYKVANGTYGDWTTINTTITSSNYQTPEEVIVLDYRQKYVFQGRIVDKLNTILTPEMSVVALPVFDWGKDDFHFNCIITLSSNSYGTTLPQNGTTGQIFFKI